MTQSKYLTTHTLKIPSIDNRIEFREYTIGEEKDIVVIDSEADENKKYYRIKNLVKKCLISDIDLEQISQAEVLFIFINIRIQSVGGDATTSVPCPICIKPIEDKLVEIEELNELLNNTTDIDNAKQLRNSIKQLRNEIKAEATKVYTEVTIDLNKVKVVIDSKHSRRVQVCDGLIFDMKYGMNNNDIIEQEPMPDNLTDEQFIDYQSNKSIELIASCVDTIFENENTLSGLLLKEKIEIIKSLPAKIVNKLTDFITTQPKVEYKGKCTCKLCNNEFEYNLSSITDFF